MKKSLVFYLFFLLKGFAFSQNIAPNPGFEDYNQCPSWFSNSYYNSFNFFNHWYPPTLGTSDYFNKCNNTVFYNLEYGKVGVPDNMVGHQEAASGNGYVGMILMLSSSHGDGTYGYADYREYLQAKLLDSMDAGNNYCISIKTSLADTSLVAIDRIGFYFSENGVFDYNYSGRLNLTPQVEFSDSILTDSLHWTTLVFNYSPDKNYKYVTFGNISPNDAANKLHLTSYLSAEQVSYHYFDDISIIKIDTFIVNAPAKVCKGQNIKLTITNGNDYKDFFWTDSISGDLLGQGNEIDFFADTTTTFKVRGLIGECELVQYYKLNVVPIQFPSVDLGKDTILCEKDVKNLDAGNSGSNFNWSTGESNQWIQVKKVGTYWVEVTPTGGCENYDTISFSNCDPEIIVIPNLFTPNNDSSNQVFLPEIVDVKNFEMEIYNRWGDLIFKTNTYTGWDGKDNQEGLYFWNLRFSGYNQEEWKVLNGWVQLVR